MSQQVGLRRWVLAVLDVWVASGATKRVGAARIAFLHVVARASQVLGGSWQEGRQGGQSLAASLERVAFESTKVQLGPSAGC